jgi:hypothetical protein
MSRNSPTTTLSADAAFAMADGLEDDVRAVKGFADILRLVVLRDQGIDKEDLLALHRLADVIGERAEVIEQVRVAA